MIFVDANVFMYAAGRSSPKRRPCRTFLDRAIGGEPGFEACTNSEVLQEILHRYRVLGEPETGLRLFDAVVGLALPVLPVAEEDVVRARALVEAIPHLSTRDAVHVGVMRGNGLTRLVSYDRGFDRVEGIERREP